MRARGRGDAAGASRREPVRGSGRRSRKRSSRAGRRARTAGSADPRCPGRTPSMGSESGTSVIVRIGALSSPMASLEASTELACGCGFRSASPASTITSASSTRIPIAGTSSSDPVDAARDRSGRGRLDDRRAGPRIPRKDPSPWRHDVRQPGDRQVLERDRASERDHDRDGDRGPQPVLDSPRVAAGAFRLAADREERADADREGEPDRVLAHDRREGRARGAHEVTARLARPPDPAAPELSMSLQVGSRRVRSRAARCPSRAPLTRANSGIAPSSSARATACRWTNTPTGGRPRAWFATRRPIGALRA